MLASPWRQPELADLTFGQIYRLVDGFLIGRKLRILDVGCGRGFLSLELARKGHDVIGMDLDSKLVKTAKQAMITDPYKSKRGTLEYQTADFSSWKNQGKVFDLIIFSRVLHHIPKPDKALDKVQGMLSSRGRIMCVEYAYDRFDRRSATWFYHIRRILEQAGWYESDRRLSDNVKKSVDQILNHLNSYPRKERRNKFEQMYKPLRRRFKQMHFSWEPYIFWDIIMDMRVPSAETEVAIARSVEAMEQALIRKHSISPTLFFFVGQTRNRSG